MPCTKPLLSALSLPLAFLMLILLVSCKDSVGPEILPPELSAPAVMGALVNEEFSASITASDPQDLDLDILFDGKPQWLDFIPGLMLLQGTPGPGDAGEHAITIIANNGSNTTSLEVKLTVFATETRYREFQLRMHLAASRSSITSGLRGVSMAVIDRNGELFTASVGDMGPAVSHLPLDESSRFRVASVTKPMTAALVLRLVDDGVIGLDDILTNHYATPLPNAGSMTLRQMLSHTAGVFDHLNSNAFWSHPAFSPTKVWSVSELVFFAVQNGPRFPPGTAYGYSNTAFCVLGAVVEEATGLSLEDVFEQIMFEPLGLENTVYDNFSTASNPIPGLAQNHRTYEYHLSAAGAAGAIAATPTDVATFGWNFYGGRFLSPELTQELNVNIGSRFGGQPYGLGTRIWNVGGIPHHGHTGSLMNYRAILMYVPGFDLSIAIHTHDTHTSWFNLVDDLFLYSVEHFGRAELPPVVRTEPYRQQRISAYEELY